MGHFISALPRLFTGQALLRIHIHGRAQGRARITGGRLHPDGFEWSMIAQAGIHDAVEGHPTTHTSVIDSGFPLQPGNEFQYRFFQNQLNRMGQVEMKVIEWGHLSTGRGQIFYQFKRIDAVAAGFFIDTNALAEIISVNRFAIGGQRHHFIFV